MRMERREFLSAAALAAVFAKGASARAAEGGGGVAVGEPMLQQPGDTTMAIAWGVTQLAYGAVEVSEDATFAKLRRFVCSRGYGVPDCDDVALQALVTGLKPDTSYFYRTVTTPVLSYPNAYGIVTGAPLVGRIHSFRTIGRSGESRFAVINDTHGVWAPFDRVANKVLELKPPFCVWNGDATNSSETKREAARPFFDPEIGRKDYASDIPFAFVYGNHDYRGKFAPHMHELIMDRPVSERSPEDAALGHNFAIRQGEIAVLGLDTGEDKTDDHPQMMGYAAYDQHREAQALWLERTLRRPDIASAPFVVACCHIPLYDRNPNAPDGSPKFRRESDGHYFGGHFQRRCMELWGPLFTRHGVQVLVAAHEHRYRYDAPAADRPWAQVVGGAPCLGEYGGKPLPNEYPTVIECEVRDGRLRIRVHDVWRNRLAGEFAYAPRKI